MSNAIVSRLGQVNATGVTDEMFLKLFSGEVMAIFENELATAGYTQERTITSGKSAAFPIMGRTTAFYHVPGNEILGGVIKHSERLITIDDIMVTSSFIADIDELKNHYDVRSHYAMEMGRALAQTQDYHTLQVGILAARTTTSAIPGEQPAGSVITEAVANDFRDPAKLAAALFQAATVLRQKNIPIEDTVCFLPWDSYYTLVQSDKAINRDFGGEGSFTRGKVWGVAGIEVRGTNQLPNTNVTASTLLAGTNNKYVGDFRKTRGLVMHRTAVGTLRMLGLSVAMEYQLSRLGTLMVGKQMVGHGVLRPEAAIELAAL